MRSDPPITAKGDSRSGPGAGAVLLQRRSLRATWQHLRVTLTERHKLFVLTLVIGGVCGLAAVAFHLTIDLVTRLAIDPALAARGHAWIAWTLVVPTLGGARLRRAAPVRGAERARQRHPAGQGRLRAARSGPLRVRDSIGKFFISALQIGTGSSLGREGPTVQICAGIASRVGPARRRLAPEPAAPAAGRRRRRHRRRVQRAHRRGHVHDRGGRRQSRSDGAVGRHRRRRARRRHRAERARRAPGLRGPAALRPATTPRRSSCTRRSAVAAALVARSSPSRCSRCASGSSGAPSRVGAARRSAASSRARSRWSRWRPSARPASPAAATTTLGAALAGKLAVAGARSLCAHEDRRHGVLVLAAAAPAASSRRRCSSAACSAAPFGALDVALFAPRRPSPSAPSRWSAWARCSRGSSARRSPRC